MKELFTSNNPVYMLRDTNTYVLPKFKTKRYGYHSMTYIGAKLWNDINADIKELNLESFKQEVKLWLNKKSNVRDSYF